MQKSATQETLRNIQKATTRAYAAFSEDKPLGPHTIHRREIGEKDIAIDLHYCGVCHSDLHTVRNEWGGGTVYPCVVGHEMIGKVSRVGGRVSKFKKGDTVAVGCLVDSCRECESCKENLEQHCEVSPVFSYNSPEKQTGGITYGGYSKNIVVDEDFVLNVPQNIDMAAAAPLLCAGITTYSPLKRFNVGPGQKMGVVGLGGLGHMAVKFGAAMGADVCMITRTENKAEDAKRLGAGDVLISTHEEQMADNAKSFDFIIDTVSADHDVNAYLQLLKRDGNYVFVGVPSNPHAIHSFTLMFPRRQIAGSLIGGIKETQEMLDFCGKNNIVCEIEKIKMDEINEAFERMLRSDVKYRFVIDLSTLH